MHIVDYSFQVVAGYCFSDLCLVCVPLCSILKKARFALQGHTHVFLFSKSADVKDQLTDEAMNRDLPLLEMLVPR